MGGFGSGRNGGKLTISGTGCLVLGTRALTKLNLRPGMKGEGKLHYNCDEEAFSVAILIDTTDPTLPFIELAHEGRDTGATPVKYKIQLTTTQPRFGGVRWFFYCPARGFRVSKLYLPRGGRIFASRKYYGLVYQSSRDDYGSRMRRKAEKMNCALGGDGEHEPEKPKGMRWRTYNRKLEAWIETANAADRAFMIQAAKILRLL